MVLSKLPANSDGKETSTDTKERILYNNLIVVLPEMSEIQGRKVDSLYTIFTRVYRNCKEQLSNSLREQQNQLDVCSSNYFKTTG